MSDAEAVLLQITTILDEKGTTMEPDDLADLLEDLGDEVAERLEAVQEEIENGEE